MKLQRRGAELLAAEFSSHYIQFTNVLQDRAIFQIIRRGLFTVKLHVQSWIISRVIHGSQIVMEHFSS
jgi:hypothetical protein